jgi:uncharacterized membrane protein YbaN (DUF454 family)
MMKRLAKWTLGCSFLVLGIIGLFVPILQGVLFIVIGLMILSSVSPRVQKLFEKAAAKYPDQYQKIKSLEQRFLAFFKRN